MTIELAKTQGLKQGIEQQKKEVVLKSFNAGLDRQIIQQITGLNEDQIDEIINHDE